MTDLPTLVTTADLKAAAWRFCSHVNLGSKGSYLGYEAAAFPEARLFSGRERDKASQPWRGYRVIQVADADGRPIEFDVPRELDEVAQVITALRQAAAAAAADSDVVGSSYIGRDLAA